MKTKLISLLIFFILTLTRTTYSQHFTIQSPEGNQVVTDAYFDESPTYLFLSPMNKPLNPSSPAGHPILDGGWTAVAAFTDEFNNGTFDQSKWIMDYGWGNAHPQHLHYNSNTNPNCTCNYNNHQFFNYPVNGITTQGLRFEIRRQTVVNRKTEYLQDTIIQPDGKPNKRQFNYTSAMLESINSTGTPYGYFEIRCKIPKARLLIADFWLHNASDGSGQGGNTNESFYNEIDIFETDDGLTCHQTTHTRQDAGEFYHHHKEVRAMDNSYFSDDFNTYSVKWEPNKLIYYINNKIVRVVTEHIANHAMRLIANIEMDISRGLLTDAQFPVLYDIDYIRTYKRTTPTAPDPIFRINDRKSFSPSAPVICYMNGAMYLNGIESYSPNNTYFLSVRECNSSGVLTGPEAMDWLTSTEIQSIEKLNLFVFAQQHGLTIAPGKYYRVKWVAGGGTSNEENQYMRVLACSNQVMFSINGRSTTQVQVNYNNSYYIPGDAKTDGFPYLYLDGTGSNPCDGLLHLSIEPSDANWGRPHPELEEAAWLTPAEITELYNGTFDLYAFAFNRGLTLQFGTYYRVGLSAQNPWTSASKLLYISPCPNFIDFSINGNYGTSSGNAVTIDGDENHTLLNQPSRILHQPSIYLEGFKSKTSYRIGKPFMVSVQLSDAWWGRYGTEHMEWFSAEEIRRFDVRAFALSKGMTMNAGSYYRVSLSTSNPWVGKCMLLNIPGCTVQPFFTINGDDRTTYTPTVIDRRTNPYGIKLSVWGTQTHPQSGISCSPDKYYYLSIWRCQQDGYTVIGPEYGEWLDDSHTLNIGYAAGDETKSLGWFDLETFAEDHGLTLQNNAYYQVRLCTGGTWNCYLRYFRIMDSLPDDQPYTLSDPPETMDTRSPEIKLYPNPASDIVYLESGQGNLTFPVEVTVYDCHGRLVETISLEGANDPLKLSNLSAGLYIVQIRNHKTVAALKLQVTK